jgi:hypothetical protein
MSHKWFLRALAYCGCLGGMAAQAQAQTIGFLNPNVPVCFSRDYNSAHMRAHPAQRVSGMALIYVPRRAFHGGAAEPQWDNQNGDLNFNATLAVKLVGQRATHYTGANCRAPSPGLVRCVIDEDGGAFTLTQSGTGMRLENVDGLTIYRATGNGSIGGAPVRVQPDAEHRTFMLAGGQRTCRRGWSLP